MIGAGEAAICLAALVLFVAYAVFTSPAVRVFAWGALSATITHVFAGGLFVPGVVGALTCVVAAVGELRSATRQSAL